MNKKDKIYVAGHRGMAGSSLVRKLESEGYTNLILRTHSELDLTNQAEVKTFFKKESPAYVFLAAAKVGGILANDTYRADFIYTNLMIQNNVIHESYLSGVKKLLFLGSSCIYPKHAPQPLREEYLLTGSLEETNEPYAIAKIAGIKMCESYNQQYGTNFISVMPTNLYGPGDNYDLQTSHVMAALIRKFTEAKKQNYKTVTIWGTGTPKREFLHVDDLADACLFLMNNYNNHTPINIGTGKDISIKELAALIKEISGFNGTINFDKSKPDGMAKKLLDITKLFQYGWTPHYKLKAGILSVINELYK
jgi:GDP-L-fucose synthase